MSARLVNLLDIADVERSKKGKIYPKGTVYIQVSACNHNKSEKFHILNEQRELESKYAVVVPKVRCNPMYLKIALEYSVDDFFSRYVGTNINIQMDNFKFYKVLWHDNPKDQDAIAEVMESVYKDMETTKEEIEKLKSTKKYMLDGCFPN